MKNSSQRNRKQKAFGHQKKWQKKSPEVMPFKVLRLRRFLRRKFPVPDRLLGSWLREQYLILLYSVRGVGKTHVALGIANAVAAGGQFLGWTAPRPREVIYFDGEMQASSMQNRLRRIQRAGGSEMALKNLRIVNPDVQDGILPDLATEAGQRLFDEAITDNTALIIIDNLSSWCRDGRESAEMWAKILPWALKHRAEGRAMIFVHHAGKNRQQRGTSKREDSVDFTVALRRPKNYRVTDDATFEWHFEKNRQLSAEKAAPLFVRYAPNDENIWHWKFEKLVHRPNADDQGVIDLLKQKVKQAEIAKITGKKPYQVTRIKQMAIEEGLL